MDATLLDIYSEIALTPCSEEEREAEASQEEESTEEESTEEARERQERRGVMGKEENAGMG